MLDIPELILVPLSYTCMWVVPSTSIIEEQAHRYRSTAYANNQSLSLGSSKQDQRNQIPINHHDNPANAGDLG